MHSDIRKVPGAPLLTPQGRGRPRDYNFERNIADMKVGDCIEVAGKYRAIYSKFYRVKQRLELTQTYSFRSWGPYFTRIWRIT